MNAEKVTGADLERYRKAHDISQVRVGEMLGVSGPTVNRWEKEEQAIPGPAQLLLAMLIHGEMPFGGAGDEAEAEGLEAKHFWELKMTLADWHKLEGLASAGGFSTVRDYLLNLIHEHLNEEHPVERGVRAAGVEVALVAETPQAPAVGEDRQAVVYETPKRGKNNE